jgi:hypothetical protein
VRRVGGSSRPHVAKGSSNWEFSRKFAEAAPNLSHHRQEIVDATTNLFDHCPAQRTWSHQSDVPLSAKLCFTQFDTSLSVSSTSSFPLEAPRMAIYPSMCCI